ncbi:ABC transporter ATP-binding protein [Mariniblastus sp.]|nr:ABC transporter ATP-binding protein [Mariniblastus sp.]
MIEIQQLNVTHGAFELCDINLAVQTGEYAILTGPTGCGKSTLLETICGLNRMSTGRILVDGQPIHHLPPAQRQIGFVPQDAALFPEMTVEKQLGFSLMVRKVSRERYLRRINELLELLELTALRSRTPLGLSGGEKQRVAIGRALAFQPRLLCLDEPLSAIDASMRQRMVDRLKRIHAAEKTTILHATHYPDELQNIDSIGFQMEQGRLVVRQS